MNRENRTPRQRLLAAGRRRRIAGATAILALVVLIGTVYALTRPAETLEWDAQDEIHRDEPVYSASTDALPETDLNEEGAPEPEG